MNMFALQSFNVLNNQPMKGQLNAKFKSYLNHICLYILLLQIQIIKWTNYVYNFLPDVLQVTGWFILQVGSFNLYLDWKKVYFKKPFCQHYHYK